MKRYAIKANKLTRCYGPNTAVDQLILEVPEGEIFGFPGHNGAGKTTGIILRELW